AFNGFRAASQALSIGGSAGGESEEGASAAASVSPSGNRIAGSAWRQRSTAAASCLGTPGATSSKLGGVSIACLTISAGTLSSSNGSLPLMARNATTPNE